MRFLSLPQDAAPAAVRTARRPLPLLIALILLLTALAAPRPVTAAPLEPLPAPLASTAAPFGGQVQLRLVTAGLSSPVYVTHAGDGSGRLFVVQRGGLVRVVKDGALQAGSFLNLTGKVLSGGERGLLGLAFHPNFTTNRALYAYYTRPGGDIVIAKYEAAANLQSASAASEQVVLVIEHSEYANHNGGMIAFGPDGYLYLGVGDGGGAGDPHGNGQNKNTLLGKILRINVNTGNPYSNPADNPFVGVAGADEIWSYGVRNPWRFSFDRATDAMWIGDVGQGSWEEINREPADTGGRNYGWDCREGKHSYSGCAGSFTDPLVEYSHSFGCSVTGGYVYRGSLFDDFVGHYVYGDYCSGNVWTIPAGGNSPTYHGAKGVNISSFGEGENGEVYMTDLGGRLYWVVAPPFTDVANSQFLFDIMWLADSGITSGCGANRFCPATSVTREQMAAFLDRALDLDSTNQDFFTDDESSIFEASINRMAAAGITSGCSATRFCPGLTITREQMAAFLDRALDPDPTNQDFFTDDESSIFEASINRLAAAGITSGCGGNSFCPTTNVTREQMAAFLRRAFD
jgi:glucose/arabinose dehydrogenase